MERIEYKDRVTQFTYVIHMWQHYINVCSANQRFVVIGNQYTIYQVKAISIPPHTILTIPVHTKRILWSLFSNIAILLFQQRTFIIRLEK